MYGQMNEPPGARARVALTGLTVAEYFRDQEGQDVLLFIDNIFRFTQAGSEVCNGIKKYVLLDLIVMSSPTLIFISLSFRCLLCWVVSLLPWVTSQHWPLIWVQCRRESPPLKKAPSPQYK